MGAPKWAVGYNGHVCEMLLGPYLGVSARMGQKRIFDQCFQFGSPQV